MLKKLLNKLSKHITFKNEKEVVEKYLSDALSQRSYDEMQNTFNASKAANIRDNYQIVNRPKFDNLSDFPIRGDISYDLKESTNSPGHPSNFNPRGRKGGGLASFML